MFTSVKTQVKSRIFPHVQTMVKSLNIFPRLICIEPTNRCNLRCPFCLRQTMRREIGDLHSDDFQRIINQIPTLKKISLFFMGEPFLNPDIFEMITYAENKGIEVSVATNSSLLYLHTEQILESGLSYLQLSLDGMCQETLEKYRVNSDFNNTIKGIKLLCQKKLQQKNPKPFIRVRTLIFSHNEHEIPELLKLMKEIHVNEVCLVSPILDVKSESLPTSSDEWLSTKTDHQRYAEDGSLKDELQYCTWIWTPLITWEGDVIPCCVDADASIKMGNVFREPFQNIFWSASYRKLRKKMANRSLPFCKFCRHVRNRETIYRY